MEPRVIDEGGHDGVRWRVVEVGPWRYMRQEIHTPHDRRLGQTWKSVPLDPEEVWERYPYEQPSRGPLPRRVAGMLSPTAEQDSAPDDQEST